jgi:hypothetical protein
VLTLVASAFFPAGSLLAWPALIALALFGANHVLGQLVDGWRVRGRAGGGIPAGTPSPGCRRRAAADPYFGGAASGIMDKRHRPGMAQCARRRHDRILGVLIQRLE